jgi:hypothetical protein
MYKRLYDANLLLANTQGVSPSYAESGGEARLPATAVGLELKLYLEKAPKSGHEGAVASLHSSRREVWIIGDMPLAETIHWKYPSVE